MVRRCPSTRHVGVSALLCLTVDPHNATAGPALVESHAIGMGNSIPMTAAVGTSEMLPSGTSMEAPRDASRRLATSGREVSSGYGGSEAAQIPANHDSLESQQQHASSVVGKFTSPADTCRLDNSLDHLITQFEGFTDATQSMEAGKEGTTLPPIEDDLVQFTRRPAPSGQSDGDEQYNTIPRTEREHSKSSTRQDCLGLSVTDCSSNISHEAPPDPALDHDPWEGYEIIVQADPVASWEILRKAHLSYYTFKHDRKKGRRQLGVIPTEIARFLPEAFSTFTLPVLLPDGSRSRVEGVPNVDWTYLFAHTLVVTQELNRRYGALDLKMDVLKAEAQNASLKLVRFLEEQGKEWQTAATLREVASLSEMKRDIVEQKVQSGKVAGRGRRAWLERRHNQTSAIAETEIEIAVTLAAEAASLGIQRLREEERGLEEVAAREESARMSTEMELLLVDIEAANQTARLSCDRRLSANLAALRATKDAEREGESTDMVRIRAKGAEARKQAQAVIDETCGFVGALVLSTLSDPAKLLKIMAMLLGIAFVVLAVGNSVTLAAKTIRRRITKPRLIRETDLPGSLLAAAAAWASRRGRALFMTLVGKSHGRISGLHPSSLEALEGIVLPPGVEQRLRAIAISIRSAYNRGAPLPHVLIHGAPGSGKSVLARRLAKMCGLNTVVVAGGDVGSLGRTASAELSGLMMWAGGTSGVGGGLQRRGRGWRRKGRGRGVVVVMDEAEAALGDRRKGRMSENARSALNAVLLCTGELRPGFFMVLTTSRPQDLDEAILDRVDEVVHLPRPGLAERARLIRLYFSDYLHHEPPTDFLRGSAAAAAATAVETAGCREGTGIGEAGVTIHGQSHTASMNEDGTDGTSTSCGSTDDYMESNACTSGISANDDDDDNKNKLRRGVRGEVRVGTTALVTSGPQELPGCGGTENRPSVWSRVFVKKRGSGDIGGRRGVVRMSEGFKRMAPRLMAMLAVRSEGFHGRDMAHLFSAVQAAVFGSDDCELTERLWASTERQKLTEFSEKVLLTAGIPSAPNNVVAASSAPADAVSQESTTAAAASLRPPLTKRRACTPGARSPSTAFTGYDGATLIVAGEGNSNTWRGLSARFGATDAAPYCIAGIAGSGIGDGGAASDPTVLSEGGLPGRFVGKGRSASGPIAGDGAASPFAAIPSDDDRAEPRAAAAAGKESEVELELESVGRVGGAAASSSPPCDPEITRPEGFAD